MNELKKYDIRQRFEIDSWDRYAWLMKFIVNMALDLQEDYPNDRFVVVYPIEYN